MGSEDTVVHSTAVVSSQVSLGRGVRVGPWCRLEGPIRIGEGTVLESHVVLEGSVVVGRNNRLSPFVCIGGAPQDRRHSDCDGAVNIGDGNVIREYVTIHRGTPSGQGVTTVGSGCYLMVGTHLAHDTSVADSVTTANQVALAGHVTVGEGAFLGGLVGVHQLARIGRLAMIGAGSMVSQDIPPFCMAHGNHARLIGINKVGLTRAGILPEQLMALRRTFRDVFLRSGSKAERVVALEASSPGPLCQELIAFVRSSRRGVAPARVNRH